MRLVNKDQFPKRSSGRTYDCMSGLDWHDCADGIWTALEQIVDDPIAEALKDAVMS